MRSTAIAVVLAMATVPAVAQQSGTQSQGSPNAAAQAASQPPAAVQAKLRQSLEQAGFKEVKIVDATYLVHARTSDGNMAVMYIDPPAGSASTGSSASASSDTVGSSASSGQQAKAMPQTKLRDTLEKAGFKDVKIVDAAYVVTAQTSEGARAMMYINPASAASTSSPAASGSSPAKTPQSK